jgi:nicotinamidase-related amidase
MPLSTIDARAALVVVDLQNGIVGVDTEHPTAVIIERSAQLAAAFRDRDFPVVLVTAGGSAPGRTDRIRPGGVPSDPGWTDVVAELDQQPSDLLISKYCWSAFPGTSLDGDLRDAGVTQVFVTGIATSAGVESTARSAFDLRYNVVLVTDAMTDRSAEYHDRAVDLILPKMGETTTTDQVLAMLAATS